MPFILSSGGSGSTPSTLSLSTFGSSPNSSGASLAVDVLTLQPADATNPGGVSTTTQTFAGAKTFTGTIITAVLDNSGSYIVNQDSTANSSTAITLGLAKSQRVTLTGNATITMPALPSSGDEYEILLELIQDATGNRTVTWSTSPAFAWASGVTPSVNSVAGQSTFFTLRGVSTTWTGFNSSQGLGVIDGSSAPSGYIGEVASSSIAAGSAVSLTSTTVANVTSIVLSPGDWMINANVIFDPAGTTTVSKLASGVNSTSATFPTAPTGYIVSELTYATGADQGQTVPNIRVNITATTTYYLCAQATFAVSTMVVYGAITARRFR